MVVTKLFPGWPKYFQVGDHKLTDATLVHGIPHPASACSHKNEREPAETITGATCEINWDFIGNLKLKKLNVFLERRNLFSQGILNLPPDSPDAKIFKEADVDSTTSSSTDSPSTSSSSSSGTPSSSSSSSSGSGSSSDSKATPSSNDGAMLKLFESASLLVIIASVASI